MNGVKVKLFGGQIVKNLGQVTIVKVLGLAFGFFASLLIARNLGLEQFLLAIPRLLFLKNVLVPPICRDFMY